MEKEIIGVCYLAWSTSGVEGRARALGWGLGKVTSKSIIHVNMHNPNNKLGSAGLEHFWCMDEPRPCTNSQDSSWSKLGGSHHLPPL